MNPASLFQPKAFIERVVEEIRGRLGGEGAVAACSGGVDSTTAVLLARRAIGDRLTSVFIDDAFRREGEPEWVVKTLTRLGIPIKVIDARKEFFDALKGKVEPEEKRRAFRQKFYSVLGEVVEAEKAKFLVQGTIAADIVETTRGIKTQHNVLEQIGLDPGNFGFQVVEPLKSLYKPQVRELAKELGLPSEVSERMPFPGPALAIRVLGEITPERIETVRKATRIVEEELEEIHSFQCFAVLLRDKATGIIDGKRAYGNIIALRAVESSDAITARYLRINYDKLERVSRRILEEVPGIVRCLYDITDKPPATIEFE